MTDQPAEIQVLYSDSALLVVNKPAGLSTLPDGYNPTLPYVRNLLEKQYGRLWIVHRLDKETSGILLLARSPEAHRSLNTQFEERTVIKIYHALVTGVPEWQEKTVDLPLRSNGDRQHRTVVDLKIGKPAVTRLMVLENFEQHCLLEAIPATGRTHQIRAHLSAIGLFILGDHLYTPKTFPFTKAEHGQYPVDQDPLIALIKNMALHAMRIEFTHPVSGERIKFTAPYPPSLSTLLSYLRSISPHV
jgi:RluA family pseudouridine synthase